MGWPNGETVVRLRAGTATDPYSTETVQDWSAPDQLVHEGTGVAPTTIGATLSRNDVEEARQSITDGFTLYLDFGFDITALDRVLVRGGIYRVVGDPGDWRSPLTGWEPGTVVVVERVTG